MGDNGASKIGKLMEMATYLGETWGVRKAQELLIPHVLRIFSEHDHKKVKQMIVTNYPLVRTHTPEKLEAAFSNLSNNPTTRQQYHAMMAEYVTPENILKWLKNPEEWLDEEGAEDQIEELRDSAAVIETMPGGEEWLAQQVFELYRMAGMVAEDSTRKTVNE